MKTLTTGHRCRVLSLQKDCSLRVAHDWTADSHQSMTELAAQLNRDAARIAKFAGMEFHTTFRLECENFLLSAVLKAKEAAENAERLLRDAALAATDNPYLQELLTSQLTPLVGVVHGLSRWAVLERGLHEHE